MINIIFTFVITFLILFVCWFLPKAGTSEYTDPTKVELLIIAIAASLPTAMVATMF